MYYNNFKDLSLSGIGFGLMRLPSFKDNSIDYTQAQPLLTYAKNHGVNYFETGHPYHNKTCEKFASDVLSQYNRESYHIALKSLDINNYEEIFKYQINELAFKYADFYLIHGIGLNNHNGTNNYIDMLNHPEMIDFFVEKKQQGFIKYLGFSSHMDAGRLENFLHIYNGVFDFVQIQLNYYDWNFNDTQKQFSILQKYNLPIWVMEPLRGGELCKLPLPILNNLNSRMQCSQAQWGYRWLQSIPEVKVILSGMSNLPQVIDNIDTFEKHQPLTKDDFNFLINVGKSLTLKSHCTGCKYCETACPNHNNIPYIMKLLRDGIIDKNININCISCGACVNVCPQSVDILSILDRFYLKKNK